LKFVILEESIVELVASSHISKIKEILFLIFSPMYCQMVINSFEAPLILELDYGMSSKVLRGWMVAIGSTNKGFDSKAFSNSFILSFNIWFSISTSPIEDLSASPVAS
jgi:hypothetical protein